MKQNHSSLFCWEGKLFLWSLKYEERLAFPTYNGVRSRAAIGVLCRVWSFSTALSITCVFSTCPAKVHLSFYKDSFYNASWTILSQPKETKNPQSKKGLQLVTIISALILAEMYRPEWQWHSVVSATGCAIFEALVTTSSAEFLLRCLWLMSFKQLCEFTCLSGPLVQWILCLLKNLQGLAYEQWILI